MAAPGSRGWLLRGWLLRNLTGLVCAGLSLVGLGYLSAHYSGWRDMVLALVIWQVGVARPFAEMTNEGGRGGVSVG